MKMWLIEDSDEAGIGLSVFMARTEEEARKKFAKQCPTFHLDSIEEAEWVSLSEIQDESGATGYRRRKA
jgi:hypothetical protein